MEEDMVITDLWEEKFAWSSSLERYPDDPARQIEK